VERDAPARRRRQPEGAHDQRDDGEEFHPRQMAADAAVRPAAERQIAEREAVARGLRGEAVGIEPFGVVPIVRVMVRHEGADDHRRFGGNAIAAHFILDPSAAPDAVNGGPESQRFVDRPSGLHESG
jgi:hypothetical protein